MRVTSSTTTDTEFAFEFRIRVEPGSRVRACASALAPFRLLSVCSKRVSRVRIQTKDKNRLKPRDIEFIRTWGDPRMYGDAKRRVSVRIYVYVLDLIWYMCGCMSVGACVGFQAVL